MVSVAMVVSMMVVIIASSVFVWMVASIIGLGFPWREVTALTWATWHAYHAQRDMEESGFMWPWHEQYRRR
jgi:uncharacterized membrane protein